MKKNTNVLLAFDGSYQAMESVRYVSRFFQETETAINLYYVALNAPEVFLDAAKKMDTLSQIIPGKSWAEKNKKKMEKAFTTAVTILKEAGFSEDAIKTTTHLREVGVARDIMKEANGNYDALVIGRSGANPLEDLVFGSITNKLLNFSGNIPLVVVGGSPNVDKVLIGFDGSQDATRAVDEVCRTMVSDNREVMLCHVVRSLNAYLGVDHEFDGDEEDLWLNESRNIVEPKMDQAENRLIEAGFHPANVYKNVLKKKSSRSGSIIKAAAEGDFGTIVIGRRGLSRVQEYILGGVSRKILHMGRKVAIWVV